MKKTSLLVAAAAGLIGAQPAHAKKNWSIWVQCDGYAKPEAAGAKLVKGLAAVSTLGLFGIPESFNPEGRAEGLAGVEACKAALASPESGGAPWLRRVTLNQALAIHHLEAKDPESALAAIGEAEKAAGDNAANLFFARSTGVSLKLLKSAALVALGRDAEAAEAAIAAAEARPYSLRVQLTALAMMGFDHTPREAKIAIARRVVALDPESAPLAVGAYMDAHRYAEAWALLKSKWEREKALKTSGAILDFSGRGDVSAFVMAYAAARAGESGTAKEILDAREKSVKASAEALREFTVKVRKEQDPGNAIEEELLKPLTRYRTAIEAAALLVSGDAKAAARKLDGPGGFPASPMIADLISDIRAAIPPIERTGVAALDLEALRAKITGSREEHVKKITDIEFFSLLPEPEDERKLNGYSRQFGWGLKSTGFKHKLMDDGSTRVEFVGSVSSPLAVEEMTLLRAADLAQQGGHKAFAIQTRSDYSRMQQTTVYGVPSGAPSLAGYKTEMQVRFLDDPGLPGVHDAAKIISALAPVFARDKDERK